MEYWNLESIVCWIRAVVADSGRPGTPPVAFATAGGAVALFRACKDLVFDEDGSQGGQTCANNTEAQLDDTPKEHWRGVVYQHY